MGKYFYRDLKLGILGGGQLGRMLIQAAVDFNVHIRVLDPDPEAPCAGYAHAFSQGSLTDFDTVYQFGQQVDLLTIEIENVNTEALEALQAEGKTVYPDPKTIRMIQDKRAQKQFFEKHDLPTAPFKLVENKDEVQANADMLPMVQKLAKAGYDGRGVQVLKEESSLVQAFDAPGLIESFVPFEKEIAIIVARNVQGEVNTFPLVEMVFHPVHNLVEYLFSPAQLADSQIAEAEALARKLVTKLEYVGLMAVEMFALKDGKLLINELAPRPHNSGHHTIRACMTSQYEQHLRAILGLPLGDTNLMIPAAMVNILGEAGYTGPAKYEGMEEVLNMSGVYPHLYGKTQTKPHRKMGHITILDEDMERLKAKVGIVKDSLKVVC